ncbi:MAG: phosphatidylinositol glycan class B [Glaciecola sp.]|jgi:phosphatidylinositol glycan class B
MLKYIKINTISLSILFIISCITAWKSTGFYHADEHYQLIEFAGFKLGTHTESELAWEFKSQMRPTFQVGFAYFFIKGSELLNCTNPYIISFTLRLITLLMSWGAALLFIQQFSVFRKLNQNSKLLLAVTTLGCGLFHS